MPTGATREEAYYEMFHGTAHVVLGSGLTIAGATYCLTFTRMPYFQTLGVPCAVGILAGVAVRAHPGSRDRHHRQPLRSLRTQARDADPVLAADRHHDRALAGTDPGRVARAGPRRSRRPARATKTSYDDTKVHPGGHPGQRRASQAANRHFSHGPDESRGAADRGRPRSSQLVGLPRPRQDRQGACSAFPVSPGCRRSPGPMGTPIEHTSHSVPHQHAGRGPDAEHEADEGPHGRHEDSGRRNGQDRRRP